MSGFVVALFSQRTNAHTHIHINTITTLSTATSAIFCSLKTPHVLVLRITRLRYLLFCVGSREPGIELVSVDTQLLASSAAASAIAAILELSCPHPLPPAPPPRPRTRWKRGGRGGRDGYGAHAEKEDYHTHTHTCAAFRKKKTRSRTSAARRARGASRRAPLLFSSPCRLLRSSLACFSLCCRLPFPRPSPAISSHPHAVTPHRGLVPTLGVTAHTRDARTYTHTHTAREQRRADSLKEGEKKVLPHACLHLQHDRDSYTHTHVPTRTTARPACTSRGSFSLHAIVCVLPPLLWCV